MHKPIRIAALILLVLAILLPGGGAGSGTFTAALGPTATNSPEPGSMVHAATESVTPAEGSSHDMHCTIHCVFTAGPRRNAETQLIWTSLARRPESPRQMIGVTVPVPQQPPRAG